MWTEELDFATGIMVLPKRQTVLVAKQAAQVDLFSGGRLRLGFSVGWKRGEYQALGADFRTRRANCRAAGVVDSASSDIQGGLSHHRRVGDQSLACAAPYSNLDGRICRCSPAARSPLGRWLDGDLTP